MRTLGKLSLFIALVLALGCDKKRAHPEKVDKAAERAEAQLKEGEKEGSLESRCFEGDIEACDELGH